MTQDFCSPHIHSREEETFYVLAGRFQIQVGDQVAELGPGDTAFAPRNVMHAWRCIGDTKGRVLTLSTPGENFETFFTAMHDGGVGAKVALGDPSAAAAFMALTESCGIEMLTAIK